MKRTPETDPQSLIEGPVGSARRAAGGLLGGHPASVVDAAQVPVEELIYAVRCWQQLSFDTLAYSVSRSITVAWIPSR
jgi:hypothetical protein